VTLPLPFRLALRDLRGGLSSFKIFLACLVLGVAAIAGIGSISSSIVAGLAADGRVLLGGDVALRLAHRPASPEQLKWLKARADVTRVTSMRSMANRQDKTSRLLVNLKSVDGLYPLFGALKLDRDDDLKDLLAFRDNAWGAIIEPRILERLNLKIGDLVTVGSAQFRLNAIIESEPDRVSGIRAITRGPRLTINAKSLAATGLVQPGTQISYEYRLRLPATTPLIAFKKALTNKFPEAGWRIRDRTTAAPSAERFINRTAQFLTLVGLTALLIGGVGAGNAVRGYLGGKTTIIATLKCIGAERRLIFLTWLTEIAVMTGAAILIGLTIGAILPAALSAALAELLPVPLRIALYPEPLLIASCYGILVSAAFSLWPLARACSVSPGSLFRDLVVPAGSRVSWQIGLLIVLCVAALATLAIITAHDLRIAFGFVGGSAVAFGIFYGAGKLMMKLAALCSGIKSTRIRMALANLHRPGSQTANVVLSMGLGLTVLVAVVVVQSNLSRQITETMPNKAPGFYFVDIQPHQVDKFEKVVRQASPIESINRVPMLRGRITHVKGIPASEVKAGSNAAWVLRNDRGLTWSTEAPQGAKIKEGVWWPANYNGPPLVSFDAGAAAGLGLTIGDAITVNVLGRPITAKIANLRAIDWRTLRVNFVMVFSPGVIQHAPQTHIAAIRLDPQYENAVENAVAANFANISAVRVRDVLKAVSALMDRIAAAVQLTAGFTILAGTLVLAGAVAAGHQRRIYDSVVLKVLGARRRDILATLLLEYGLLALSTALLAAGLGTFAGWAVLKHVMRAEWLPVAVPVATTVIGATLFMVCVALLGTWRSLGQKPAALLRNE
jgi:putative ABC transport system permease protein